MKKILFITGTRADYGKMKSLMQEVEKNEQFELYVYISGMHLLERFGSTYNEVLQDGYKNTCVAYSLCNSHSMSYNLGDVICNLTGYVNHINPDMIVIHGDRIDALAGAVVGALNNKLVAHIEGGEVSGTIDESIRHAISKFAHLHFVSNNKAKERLMQLGEKADDIFVIGSPDIDIMISKNLPTLDETKQRYNIKYDEYGIVMYHPVTTQYDITQQRAKVLVEALIESGKKYVIIYPNSDLGCEFILNEYRKLESNPKFTIFPSMRFEYFLTLLKNAKLMIGNSSAGIRETGIYAIPAIDVGTRQEGRYNLSKQTNIIHVNEDKDEILNAINKISQFSIKSQEVFGDGDSTQRFMQVISNVKIFDRDLQKKFIDLKEIY